MNLYSITSSAVHNTYVAFDQARVSLWRLRSLRSILPALLYKLQKVSKRNIEEGAASLKSLKSLGDQLNLNAGKFFNSMKDGGYLVDYARLPGKLMDESYLTHRS